MSSTPGRGGDVGIDAGAILRRVGLFAVLLVVVVLAFSALPGVGEVRERFAATDWRWLALAGVCELISMAGFCLALWGAFDRIPPPLVAAELGMAEQGTNVLLPAGGAGGPAFGALVMRRAGVPQLLATRRHAVLFFVTSGASFGGLALLGTLSATGVLPHGSHLVGTIVPAVVGFGVIGLALLFGRLGAPAEQRPAGRLQLVVWRLRRFLHAGVADSIERIRGGDTLLVVGSVAYYAFDIAALACAFQAFGGGGPALGIFVIAYTVGHAGALIPTPGGVGGTDGGLIGAFVLYGASLPAATAAVLGYRVFQLGLPVVLGAISLLGLRHRRRHAPPPEVVADRYRDAERRARER